MLPPAKVLANPQGELPQLLVGRACVGDRWVDAAIEGHGRSSGCNHGDIPVGGEETHGRGGVGAARANKGPGVKGQFEVNSHERGDGLRADTVLVLTVLESVGQVVVRQQGGIGVDSLNRPLQGRADARPCPWVFCVGLR